MGARGPAKGTGGRPRATIHKPNARGYVRESVGPASKGTQVYSHRAAAGLGKTKGSKGGDAKVVDHQDGNRKNNTVGNLKVTSRAKNNVGRAKKSKYRAD